MDNSLYIGLSRQMVLQRQMDIIANNIANVDTTGFKVESLLLKADSETPRPAEGAPRPIQFVASDGVARDFGQGSIRATGAPFDLALEGQGYFQVATPQGNRLTRDGRFHLDETGKLVTETGAAVLDDGGGEIVLDPQKGPVSIAEDGSISQDKLKVGKVGVVDFAAPGALEKAGDNLFRNTSNIQPTPAAKARVRQGMLEGSNVNSVLEITRMIEVNRAYEATAKMMESEADLSRRAVERMGRVN
jgi:flagellar basal-body rod protein FlgF